MADLRIKLDDEREIIVKVDLFESVEEINIDKILRIDYPNLIPEILTFPAILNKLGILLANAENDLKEMELDYRIWKAKIKAEIRDDFENDPDRPIKRGYKYTIDEVDDAMRVHPVYKAKNKKVSSIQKRRDYVNSFYWSAKSKADKLEKLSLTIKPEDVDFDQLVGKFNGVLLKAKKPLI